MLAIIGAGGHAKCAYECFYLSGLEVYGFFDDDLKKTNQCIINNVLCRGPIDDILEHEKVTALFIALGDNRIRLDHYHKFKGRGYDFPNAVHQRAQISCFSEIGEGNFLMANAVVNPHSRIGNCCIINTAATIGHDCHLNDGVQVGPGANLAGGSIIGEGVFMGTGTKICPGVSVEEWAVIGAGSVVLDNLEGNAFYYGIPARKIKRIDNKGNRA